MSKRRRTNKDDYENDSASDSESVTPQNGHSNTLSDNNQKSFYYIKPKVSQKKSSQVDLSSKFTTLLSCLMGSNTNYQDSNSSKRPKRADSNMFINLFNGKESNEQVNRRFELYQHYWNSQHKKVDDILNNTNKQLFLQLQNFINRDHQSSRFNKLPLGFLQLSSNTANNLRILQEFNKFLTLENQKSDTEFDYKIINMSSKHCYHIKATLRELVKQMLNAIENGNSNTNMPQRVGDDNDDDEEEEVIDDDNDEVEDDNQYQSINTKGKLQYDLDMIEEWYNDKYNQKKSLRFIIVLQDTNSISNHVINQLIKILYGYRSTLPLKLILGLSANNISNWINNNFNNEIRILTNGFKFKCNDNRTLGYLILESLFLTDMDDENSDQPLNLLLNFKTSTILLSRFENSNNSIDSLIAEIKLCYMIHFYNSPLSALIKYDNVSAEYTNGLKKLPSFKKYIERKIYEHKVDDIEELLQDDNDDRIKQLLIEKRKDFINYINTVIGYIKILDKLQTLVNFEPRKEHLELYKLIISNSAIPSSSATTSVFISELVGQFVDSDNFESNFAALRSFLISYDSETPVILKLRSLISGSSAKDSGFKKLLTNFFQPISTMESLQDFLFNEIFTMNGGIVSQSSQPINEESYENLMINLIRPNLRSSIELGLDNCSTYLKNPFFYKQLNEKLSNLNPIITQLFRVYKEAPTTINVFDFYMAFKQSLNKNEIKVLIESFIKDESSDKYIQTLDIENNEDDWNKLTFAWFVQNCQELVMMGLLKEKPKGDHLEKVIWKGI